MIAPPQQPSHDELELLIKEARARQLRRRLLGAAGVAIAAAFGLSIYAVTIGGGSGSLASDVPTRPLPGCRSSQLSANAELNGATGSLMGAVMIAATGSACSLPRLRPAVRITSNGTTEPVKQAALQPLDPDAVPRLAPGAMAEVYVQWSNWCGKPPSALTLRFDHDAQVTAPLTHTQPGCGDPSFASRIAVSGLLTPAN